MAGEMNKEEIEVGGDWYSVRLELEDVAKDMGSKKFAIKAFDQYQGPFCFMNDLQGALWKTDNEFEYYFEASRGSGLHELNQTFQIEFAKELGKKIKRHLKINKGAA